MGITQPTQPQSAPPPKEVAPVASAPIQTPEVPAPKRHPVMYFVLTILLVGANIASYLFVEGNFMSTYFLYSAIFLGACLLAWLIGLYRPLRFIFGIFLVLLFAFSVVNPLWTKIMPPAKDGTEKADIAISNFFDAKSKHGTFNYYIDRGGKIVEQDVGEYWIKGNKFVLQYPENPTSKIKVVSNNGTDVYFCYESKKACEPSPMSIDYYLMHYTKTYGTPENMGLDQKENCRKYRYSLKKIEEKAGSQNPWYVEDIIYCATNDSLYYFEDTGNSAKNGTPTELRLFHADLKAIDLIKDIPDSTFELPYTPSEEKPATPAVTTPTTTPEKK